MVRIESMSQERKKYLIVFFITLGIFIVVFGMVNFLNQKKLANIDNLQRKITADLIATETQFDLLKSAPCSAIGNTILSAELGELGRKLDFAETNQGIKDPSVLQLKKYYSLLQVKDYLLMQELASKCEIKSDSLLYFYNNDCAECVKQGYVLTEFKERYPDLRIYSFDSGLDFSVINTFIGLYDFEDVYPTLIAHDVTYQGFVGLSELEKIFPELLQQKLQKEMIEKGKEYIKGIAEYVDAEEKDIVFLNQKENTYTFVLATENNDNIIIVLEYNKEIKKFSELKKPTTKKGV